MMRVHVHYVGDNPSYWLAQTIAAADFTTQIPDASSGTIRRQVELLGGVFVPRKFACRSPIINTLLEQKAFTSRFTLTNDEVKVVYGLEKGGSLDTAKSILLSEYQDLTDDKISFALWRACKEADIIPIVAFDHELAKQYDITDLGRVMEYHCTYTRVLMYAVANKCDDLTLIIPVKIDSVDRLNNLMLTIKYAIDVYRVQHIIVSEYDDTPKLPQLLQAFPQVRYCFMQPIPGTSWNRGLAANAGAHLVTTSILAIWDADIILPVTSIETAIRALKTTEHDACVPYSIFVNLHRDASSIFRDRHLSKRDLSGFVREESEFNVGGELGCTAACVFVRTSTYRHIRGMSELFHGWGWEDIEFAGRLRALCSVTVLTGSLYHISHERTATCKPDPRTERYNRGECFRIQSLTKPELLDYLGITETLGAMQNGPIEWTGELGDLPDTNHSIAVNKEDLASPLLVTH